MWTNPCIWICGRSIAVSICAKLGCAAAAAAYRAGEGRDNSAGSRSGWRCRHRRPSGRSGRSCMVRTQLDERPKLVFAKGATPPQRLQGHSAAHHSAKRAGSTWLARLSTAVQKAWPLIEKSLLAHLQEVPRVRLRANHSHGLSIRRDTSRRQCFQNFSAVQGEMMQQTYAAAT